MYLKIYKGLSFLGAILVFLGCIYLTWPPKLNHWQLLLSNGPQEVLETVSQSKLPMPSWVSGNEHKQWLVESIYHSLSGLFRSVKVVMGGDQTIVELGFPIEPVTATNIDWASHVKVINEDQLNRLLAHPLSYMRSRKNELNRVRAKAISRYRKELNIVQDAFYIAKANGQSSDIGFGTVSDDLKFVYGTKKLQKVIDGIAVIIKNPEFYDSSTRSIFNEQARYDKLIEDFKRIFPANVFEVSVIENRSLKWLQNIRSLFCSLLLSLICMSMFKNLGVFINQKITIKE
ncbi:MAG TPA: hypothetical protein DCE52_18175 [Rhodobacteraceae bacterium]|nr:hypothetical protein [Paracoccaceae bacterium]